MACRSYSLEIHVVRYTNIGCALEQLSTQVPLLKSYVEARYYWLRVVEKTKYKAFLWPCLVNGRHQYVELKS